jgi:hypothetical protein
LRSGRWQLPPGRRRKCSWYSCCTVWRLGAQAVPR